MRKPTQGTWKGGDSTCKKKYFETGDLADGGFEKEGEQRISRTFIPTFCISEKEKVGTGLKKETQEGVKNAAAPRRSG